MQRDYFLRIIEQVAQLLARAIRQREASSPQEALQSIMAACERLFAMEAVQLFQFTPDQHAVMLAEGEPPEAAYDKIMIYAALNEQASLCYTSLGQPALARQSLLNALRLSLKAQQQFAGFAPPDYLPPPEKLLAALGDTPLDEDTNELIAAAGLKRPSA